MLSTVITKVFPDEFHLHTLDLLLSAIARLNPHVDLKKIVIGLMDRLSSYAQKDTESRLEPEARKQNEEEAVTRLLQKLELDKENKKPESTEASAAATTKENGTDETSKLEETSESAKEPEQAANGEDEKAASPAEAKLYDIFYKQVVDLIKTRALPIQDAMALLVSLVNLALNIYPDQLEYVDQVLDFAAQKTAEYTDHADLHSAPTQQHILHLLNAPLHSYVSIFTALALPHYLPLLTSQSYPTRRSVAGEIIRSLLKNKIPVSSTENLDRVLQTAKVLIKEGIQQSAGYPGVQTQRRGGETDETIEEQGWLARLVHLIQAPDNDTQLKVWSPSMTLCSMLILYPKLLQATRKAYMEGNERIRYTTPAIITASIRLARKLKSREHFDDNWQSQSSALYRFMHQCVNNLYQRVNPGCADLALRLFVMCGEVADQTGFEEVSYEFFAQAFTIYEDAISDSRAQFQAVCVIAGALHGARGFSKENYDTLITKAALHGSKLLKKPDQCRAVYLASHLWWVVENPQRVDEDPQSVS